MNQDILTILLGKPNDPQDCSSFIGEITLQIDQMSTADLWKRYQYQREGYPNDPIWEKSATGKLLIKNYTVVKPEDIQPSDIWATRSFDTQVDPEMKGFGKGGHTVLIVDKPTKGQKEIMTLGYNRNMPENEGFGKQVYPIYPQAGESKRIFFSE